MTSVHDPSVRNGTIPSQIPRNDNVNFHRFFDSWLTQQSQDLENLVNASNDPDLTPSSLLGLVGSVLEHYERYYREKSRCAHENILLMMTPPWRSSFEDSFLWIGGWRPSMAFHLLYSKSGVQLEARLEEVLRGFRVGDLADLSPDQLLQINSLQLGMITKEKEVFSSPVSSPLFYTRNQSSGDSCSIDDQVTELLARQQETIAGTSVVELSHEATQRMRNGADTAVLEAEVERAMREEEKGMEEVLRAADELRLETLKEIVKVLTPKQAVHFLMAAAELHLRVHDWGVKKDSAAAAMQQSYIQQQQQQEEVDQEGGGGGHHLHHQHAENGREI